MTVPNLPMLPKEVGKARETQKPNDTENRRLCKGIHEHDIPLLGVLSSESGSIHEVRKLCFKWRSQELA